MVRTAERQVSSDERESRVQTSLPASDDHELEAAKLETQLVPAGMALWLSALGLLHGPPSPFFGGALRTSLETLPTLDNSLI